MQEGQDGQAGFKIGEFAFPEAGNLGDYIGPPIDLFWGVEDVGPNGAVIFDPPTKVVDTPASGEVTIGEEIIYHIRVPGNVPNAAMYDVVITDTLHPSLEYISATDISGNALAITDNTAGNNVSLSIANIAAG